MKEQRKFFEASIEFCDRCGNVKDVNQFEVVIHLQKTNEHLAVCKTCYKEKSFKHLLNLCLKYGSAKFERREK